MNNICLLKIAKNNTCGLCNQIYALTGCIDYSIFTKQYTTIIVDEFLKEINTDNYCPISEIFDITEFNKFLKQYNILLVDKKNVNFEIISIHYGNENVKVDITKDILDKYYCNNILFISNKIHLNSIKGDPIENYEKNVYFKYKIQDNIIENVYPELGGYLKNEIFFNFQLSSNMFTESPQLYFGGSRNPELFVNIIKNIKFKNYYFETTKYLLEKPFLTNQKINFIHLRLEKDCINHFSKETRLTPEAFEFYLEHKYIETIQKYIQKTDMTIVISSDYNNGVVNYLKNNNYCFQTTKKPYKYRELNAITDLLLSEYCNNIFIGVYESSYSYTCMYRIFEKQSEALSVIITMNNLVKQPSIFTKKSSIYDIQHG